MILRARVVLPVSQPPIADGAVLIAGRRIQWVGPWKELPRRPRARLFDLGDSVLLPGLVNAHCHLDYTHMAGMLPPQNSFVDWIKLITTAKAGWDRSEFAASWREGARMLLRTGTTTVADFEALPELLPEMWADTPLRVISFLELTGVRSRRNPRAIVQEALARIEKLPRARCRAVLAPHAPYSTVPQLLRLSAQAARRRRWPLSIHVAESSQEFEMFARGQGPMYDWLKRNERDMADCGAGSPVRHLEQNRVLGKNLLAVHANYLGDHDAARLRRSRTSVVHCPRSHDYFRHAKFPLRQLLRARVNVCLGTDSLATVYKRRQETVELSLFDELRAFARAHPRLALKRILEMATVNGARALGLAGKIGQLSPGALADLISLPFAGNTAEAAEAVVRHSGEVTASLIDGQWAIEPKG